MAILSIFTNLIIVFEQSESLCEALGFDIEDRTKWIVAFLFEHVIILIVIIFFVGTRNESKGITKLKSLSRTIKNFTLAVHNPSDTQVGTAEGGSDGWSKSAGAQRQDDIDDKRAMTAVAAVKRQQDLANRGKPKKGAVADTQGVLGGAPNDD